ncbi:carbohydrate ABC transporter permease [Paenibacillus puerhi]|uniref:carbohydrate ABC transporter permease n=1 Tax=Paenibacillus puerhi TaxID=2692622 RepID=UPI00191607C2|nr:sugar ABC transporter permease [Paenibacillus puerhi]
MQNVESYQRIKKRRDMKSLTYFLMLLPAIICVIVTALVPMLGMMGISFMNWDLTSSIPPKFNGLDNFITMFKDARFLNSMKVQVILSVFILLAQLLLGLVAAIALNNASGKLKWVRGIVMAPFMIPAVVVGLIWLTIFTPTLSPINSILEAIGLPSPSWLATPGLSLTSIVIADTWNNLPFVMLILLASLQGIPKDLYEAAEVDGATTWKATLFITLPALKPALVLVGLIRFIESLKSFPLIYIMTGGGPGTATEVTNFYAFIQGFQYSKIGYASSLAFLLFLITVVISFITIYLDRGSEEE